MTKKEYLSPSIKVEDTLNEILLSGSVQKIESNEDIGFGGGGDGPVRARGNGSFSAWDDEDEQ